MKKTQWILGLVVIVALTIGVTGYAYAHGGNPPQNFDGPFGPGAGYGHSGMMGGNSGYGMMGGYGMMDTDGEYGPMHETMVNTLAEATGLSADEIEARHDAGDTMWDIAADAGLSEDEISDLMLSARGVALDDAVANGWMTAEQADWMNEHMSEMWSGDYGSGGCDGHGRGFGNSAWQGNQN